MIPRRRIIQSVPIMAFGPALPQFLHACESESHSSENILVVIQLSGGNDGLNTLVPYSNDVYRRSRPKLRIAPNAVIRIDEHAGFHPAMTGMGELLNEGKLAVVQGVGYPFSSRSHDVSMSVWHTASTDDKEHNGMGWLGKALDQLPIDPAIPSSLFVSNEPMVNAIRGRKCTSASMQSLQEFNLQRVRLNISGMPKDSPLIASIKRSQMNAYGAASRIREAADKTISRSEFNLSRLQNPLAQQLKIILGMIECDYGARVYYTLQSGYDTHAKQEPYHTDLLQTLSSSLKAFLDDLAKTQNADRVLVLCFSEFGRQLQENASAGTDHGTAGPVFLAGNRVRAGIHGAPVDLQRLIGNAPEFTVDFRDVYANVLKKWMQVSAEEIVPHPDSSLDLIL
jgi:uncharacterized protein (DUF1501 family)